MKHHWILTTSSLTFCINFSTLLLRWTFKCLEGYSLDLKISRLCDTESNTVKH